MTKTMVLAGCLVLSLAPARAQQRVQAIGTPTARVRYREVRNTVATVAAAATDEATITAVTARFSGWIEKLKADTQYQHVTRGETLCTIYSPRIYAAEQDYLFAVRNRATLTSSTVAGVAAGAAALVTDARQRLKQLQVPAAEIARLVRTGVAQQRFSIPSPITGIVSQREALPGLHVQAGSLLYTLTALRPIWVLAEVEEADLGSIRIGQSATVNMDAFPGRTFHARVDFINPQVDASSRTDRIRLLLPNQDLALAPGMFGTATIMVPLGRHLVVPASAVLQSGTGALAFVAEGGGRFTPQKVETGLQVGNDIIIRKGLRAGERVATGATFLVASEAQLTAAAGSYAPPPPGVSAAAQSHRAAAQAHIALTTAPSPARKGRNTFRVYLTTATGAPITGAAVAVTLSMAAMPAMGMAAMHVTVPLQEQGGGRYRGSGTLGSSGNWQVAITATKGGRLLAAAHTSVRAAGGM
ncbi:MAG: efflux RND transporter periplasmic adaptor subunit [Terriglobales bacterium]